MTYKEAILRIVDHNEIHSRKEKNFAIYITEALNMAVEALKKQIPKKVRIREPLSVKAFDGTDKVVTFRCYPCPCCGKWIADNEGHKHCEWCGQALDWGEDK